MKFIKGIKARKFLTAALAFMMFAGCTAGEKAEEVSESPSAVVSESSQADTGEIDASQEEGVTPKDDIVNTSPAEKVILAVSFGTSYAGSRGLDIGGIEGAVKEAFPDYQVRRAFTSQIIIDKLSERDGLDIDNLEAAFERMVSDGVKEVIVQPTHIIAGYEYTDLAETAAEYASRFDSLKLGKPLLSSDEAISAAVDVVTAETAEFITDKAAVVFMGHGTEHEANETYAKLQQAIDAKDFEFSNYYLATAEGEPSLTEVIEALKEKGIEKVTLAPLMVVAGDHANNDMASDETDSWKSILEGEGFEVETVIEGLGRSADIQEIYIQHINDAVDSESLESDGNLGESIEDNQPAGIDVSSLADGTYSITVDSDSSMFRIEECELTVENGVGTALITLSGQGFREVYMGTGEEALKDTDEGHIPFIEAGERHAFLVPVEVLDTEVDCSGFSDDREEWYDHKIVFQSPDIPDEAFSASQIEVTLSGGSGKAAVESPAELFRKDGRDYARIVWSSPNYSYMVVDGVTLYPVNTEGNSTFEVPVVLDKDINIIACTTAMSAPREIEYVLRFGSGN